MLNRGVDAGDEPSVQDSLLKTPDPLVKANTNSSSTTLDDSLEHKTLPNSSALHAANDYWSWDIFGIFSSAAILIGIAIILNQFDGKRQPSWEHVSLNSLISWLSTAAKLFLLVPVSRSLGQLKWVWFAETERPLSDLEKFDFASRGITGSVKLLWKLKGL
jgi:hypothetical protein